VFGKRAGDYAAKYARGGGVGAIEPAEVEDAVRCALEPFERGAGPNGEGPFQVQQELQVMMQDLVGIVRNAPEMERALEGIGRLRERATRVGVAGNREYNPGWHTALDLGNLLIISEAVTRSAIEREESRGGHFREDRPDKDPAFAKFNIVVRKGADGAMRLTREQVREMSAELKRVLEEQK
jgi:succinate dehydrogenase / fumarate reductase, flavoprotein subunit